VNAEVLIRNMPDNVRQRFWSKVDKSGGCWNWIASRNRKGYGQFDWRKLGRPYLAHRVSWIMHNGGDLGGLCVLHRCDNPACVNPSHLWVGTPAENSTDMVKKGRSSKGENHCHAKLTPSDIVKIRDLFSQGALTQAQIGERFGVARTTISSIVTRRNWGYISAKGKENGIQKD